MKKLTKTLLKFNFNGLDITKVAKIEFAFSQFKGEKPKKKAVYPGADTVGLGDSVVGVIWTPQETTLFEADKYLYADTRITMKDTEYQPETDILKLEMKPTLFEEGAV